MHAGLFFEGYRYWVCKGYQSSFDFDDDFFYPNHIMYFDPQNNEFIKVHMQQPKEDGDIINDLGVLDGCLCVIW